MNEVERTEMKRLIEYFFDEKEAKNKAEWRKIAWYIVFFALGCLYSALIYAFNQKQFCGW